MRIITDLLWLSAMAAGLVAAIGVAFGGVMHLIPEPLARAMFVYGILSGFCLGVSFMLAFALETIFEFTL